MATAKPLPTAFPYKVSAEGSPPTKALPLTTADSAEPSAFIVRQTETNRLEVIDDLEAEIKPSKGETSFEDEDIVVKTYDAEGTPGGISEQASLSDLSLNDSNGHDHLKVSDPYVIYRMKSFNILEIQPVFSDI